MTIPGNLIATVFAKTATSGLLTSTTLTATLNNPNAYGTSAGDVFGLAVAIDGNYAIVGAFAEDDAGGEMSGKAYIFNVTTGQLLWTLNNPNAYGTSASDQFGYVVDISDNYAIVGAKAEDDAGGLNSGKAYIYDVTTGQLLRTLNNPNAYGTSENDAFGGSVAISGNYAIVGAYAEADTGGLYSGKAYIFDVTTGALTQTLTNPNAYGLSETDFFGYLANGVDISGNYAIVGAPGEGDTSGVNSGKAYIFNVTTGQLVYTLANPSAYSTGVGDNFGNAVAISNNYAIVGANLEGDASGANSGKAYIFSLANGQLLWTLNNPNPYGTSADDNFGYDVAISGNYAIVGAYAEGDASGLYSGKAYIYNAATGALVKTIDNPNAYGTSANDYFGLSVDISGNRAIVGAYDEGDSGGTGSGKSYVYLLDGVPAIVPTTAPTAAPTSAPTAAPTGQPVAASTWSASSGDWSVSGATATAITSPAHAGSVLHGPVLLPGQYADVTISTGFPSAIAFLGVSDTYGSWTWGGGTKYRTWYWSGVSYNDSVGTGPAPSELTAGRYRISYQTGGVIKMSKVSSDGSTLVGTVLTSPALTGAWNTANLHVVLFPQDGYVLPATTTINVVANGTGGL